MLSVRERPLPLSPLPARLRPPAPRQLLLDELDELQAWRDRDVNDLDVDEADDLELLARLRDENNATDWLGI
jgi:hypothetical protein